ncbi:MAG: hypothetical protein AVDCRST_MAG26-1552 [uncultured Chloroflexia bacterium]|uniref:Uncharacterized protein n=1 Tax=uncultured Chloroflexia bacterium TaxID=1672391 RepID=A0A6J4I8P4_9CHLR|nr:MAG: hypothetical protein AVDCRST_MAG26-1552 [uncultured Chloroflexia bacterium]
MEPTIQDLREELQQTRKDLRLQRVWNANLEDAVTAPEVEIREVPLYRCLPDQR